MFIKQSVLFNRQHDWREGNLQHEVYVLFLCIAFPRINDSSRFYHTSPLTSRPTELGDPELERRFDDPSNDVDFVSPRGTGGGNSNAEGRHSLSARKHTRQTESQILAESEESGFIGRAATIQSVTKIDLGLNSQLTGPRGTTITLIFEVTNFRQTPVFYYFRVTDELGFLRSLNPGS